MDSNKTTQIENLNDLNAEEKTQLQDCISRDYTTPPHKETRLDTRDSSIELLRILSMLMIVAHHIVLHGGILDNSGGNIAKLICGGIFIPGGKIGFDCFIFISAWFMSSKAFSGNRYIKIALETIFYNILGMALAALINNGLIAPITWQNWIGCFLPLFGISHGFAIYYLIFLIILPFLQKATENMSKINIISIVILLFMMQLGSSIIAKLIDFDYKQFTDVTIGLTTFIIIYFLSVYLHKYPLKITDSKLIMSVVFILIWIIFATVNILSEKYPENNIFSLIYAVIGSEISPLNIIAGICIFFLFKNIRIKNIKAINFIASHTFGILLLHDHNYFRYIIWERVFGVSKVYPANALIQLAYTIIVALIVFAAGVLIDIIREYLLEKPLTKTKLYSKACDLLEKCFKF